MNLQAHDQLKNHIWEIANRLRGPYRPPQYRLVMLPMVVLRRLDSVLEPTKDAVLKEYDKLTAQNMPESAMERLLGREIPLGEVEDRLEANFVRVFGYEPSSIIRDTAPAAVVTV